MRSTVALARPSRQRPTARAYALRPLATAVGAKVGLALWLALGASAAAAPAPGPVLLVESPPELATAAERIRSVEPAQLAATMKLIGLDSPGPPIRVVLAPEDSPTARNTAPWIAGYAYGASGLVVLFPERTPSYPDSSFEELLRHEIAHVLIARAAAGGEVPRWFNEGVAMIAGGSWDLGDRSRMTVALLLDTRVTLTELDLRFAGGRRRTAAAYAVSEALVRDLLRRHGPEVIPALLGAVRAGDSFDQAVVRVTGLDLERIASSFWRRQSFWYRWVPILTSSFTLWTGITLLALLATVRRKQKDAALRRLWDEEERHLAELAAPSDDGELVN